MATRTLKHESKHTNEPARDGNGYTPVSTTGTEMVVWTPVPQHTAMCVLDNLAMRNSPEDIPEGNSIYVLPDDVYQSDGKTWSPMMSTVNNLQVDAGYIDARGKQTELGLDVYRDHMENGPATFVEENEAEEAARQEELKETMESMGLEHKEPSAYPEVKKRSLKTGMLIGAIAGGYLGKGVGGAVLGAIGGAAVVGVMNAASRIKARLQYIKQTVQEATKETKVLDGVTEPVEEHEQEVLEPERGSDGVEPEKASDVIDVDWKPVDEKESGNDFGGFDGNDADYVVLGEGNGGFSGGAGRASLPASDVKSLPSPRTGIPDAPEADGGYGNEGSGYDL